MIYFTSDLHFGHANVIKYCARPYSSVDEMNEMLVANWNSVVKPEDTAVFLGDLSMAFAATERFTYRLNGSKIMVPGNHDFCHTFHKKSRTEENHAKWVEAHEKLGWFVAPQIWMDPFAAEPKFLMCHHPYSEGPGDEDKYANWRPTDEGLLLLCGHVHEKWKTKRSPKGTLQINVGCDVWDYKPVSLDQLLQLAEQENGKKA